MPHDNPPLEKLRQRVAEIDTKPGVYRWLNDKGEVLYVGKAKNLRSRLKSYVLPATDGSLGPWKTALVGKIADLEVTVTANELEALILETNLIKEIRPKYNVLMKDGKNYVYVKVSVQDVYPLLSIVRKLEDDGAKYFGPYLSKYHLDRTLDQLHEVFPYKTSKQVVEALNRRARDGDSEEPIQDTPSLECQIGKHCGLGMGSCTREQYLQALEQVMRFLKGNHDEAKKAFMEQMQQAAADKKFERAAKLRDALQFIDSTSQQQVVSDTSRENIDAIGLVLQSDKTQVVVLRERNGKLIEDYSFALGGQAESVAAALEQFIPQYYSATDDIPDTILIHESMEDTDVLEEWLSTQRNKKVEIRVPERGKKSKLLTMAETNARNKVQQQLAKWEAQQQNIEVALNELESLLNLSGPPKRIEGYDISHLGGTETVGSMVVTQNGKSKNDQYRSFTIRTLQEGQIDDYAALQEVLRRRLLHLVRNIKEEEKVWNEQGITFGKARKSEQQWLMDTIEADPALSNDNLDYKDFLVARRDDQVVGFVRLYLHEDKTLEIKSVWVDPSTRGQKLGQFLVRKLLGSIKKEKKVYTILDPDPKLEEYYADIGFRHVHNPPETLLQKTREFCKDLCGVDEGTIMVYIFVDHKADKSLQSRPDLLMIDGGKGQLSAVSAVLKDLELEIPVIGLAKREEEVFLPGESVPVVFPKDSQGKFLLMRLRDEAHRFANRHREKRGAKAAVHSALDDVPGIGEKTKQELLKKFGSVEGVKKASDEELSHLLSEDLIKLLRNTI